MRLTSGWFTNRADRARWDYVHPTGRTIEIEFDSVDLAGGHRDHGRTWFAHDAPGEYFLEPMIATASDTELTQNSATTQVLFGSELTADVTRTATELTWAATATQWSGRSATYVARPGATVAVLHQAKTGAPWTYVTSVRTATGGKAMVSVSSPEAGNYRLVLAGTRTVAAAYSRTIKGRVRPTRPFLTVSFPSRRR